MTDITAQVQNYKGSNSFIIKMRDAISKYGSLTINQRNAVERIFKSVNEVKKVELVGDLKTISEYEGQNSFVNDIKNKLNEFGKLSEKQVAAAMKQIQKDNDKQNSVKLNIPVIGDTLKVRRKTGQGLKEKYDLKFNPILLDITRVMEITPKAVKFKGKLTIKRGSVCTCCMKTLTDEFSMLTGLGKICASHMGVSYITDKSQAQQFREEYMKRVDEIGEMEFWVPKSQIQVWEGNADVLLSMF